MLRKFTVKDCGVIHDITDEELGIPVLLYGDVKLVVEEKASEYRKGQSYYKVNFLDRRSGKHIRYFNLNKFDGEVDPQRVYHVAIVAIFRRNAEGKLISKIYRQDAMRYIEIA